VERLGTLRTDALAGTINIMTQDTPPRRESGFRFGGVLDTFYTRMRTAGRGNLALNGAGKYFAFRIAQSMERFDNYFAGNATPEERRGSSRRRSADHR
jgi:hypothetical protein